MRYVAGDKQRSIKFCSARGLYVAAGLFLLALILVLSLLAAQLVQELSRLRSASTDNVQWTMAQLQVELLVLQQTIIEASSEEDPESLDEVRQRFDIFYSRIDTLRNGSVFSEGADSLAARARLDEIALELRRAIPFVDGTNRALFDALPELYETFGEMQPHIRAIALRGVRLLAERSDEERQAFSGLLLRTGLLAVGVIAAMFLALFLALWQFRVAGQKTQDLQAQNLLYESALNAALEAIIVSNEAGYILDFNPAAVQLFGYTREQALGAKAEQLIIPGEELELHRKRRSEFLSQSDGAALNLSGRMEVNAKRANGDIFPAEVSVGVTRRGEARTIVSYIRDISDRRRVQENLTRARDEAMAVAKAKTDFLAVMSHEMRTPLNGVMGLLDLLNETRLTRKQRDYVKTALSSGEILQHHVDDVLNITRIEAGVTALDPVRIEVGPLLTEIKKMNDPAAAARGNIIKVDVEAGLETFDQDRHGLRQVLINLVSNAIKFTRNGAITITARQGTPVGWIELSVSDTGIGIDDDDQAKIFDDFVMLDSSYQRLTSGSGLGLGISRRIAGLLGGEIGVESTPKKGSRFFLKLPPLPVIEDPCPPEDLQQRQVSPERSAGASVLLVEDNETNRFVAREMLSEYRCAVSEARDGLEGVEMAAKQKFDLILMDVSMPRMDGLGATRAIREGDGRSRETPIVGLTAHALPHELAKLKNAGMQDCITKPLRRTKVAELIASLPGTVAAIGPTDEITTAPAGIDGTLVDLETLNDLKQALPATLLEQQIKRFRTELDDTCARFCAEMSDVTDLEELAAYAHRMAGAAAVFGAFAMRSVLLEIESAAKHGERDKLQPLCNQARGLAERTLAHLSTLVA
ncbi:response regulator [Martelella mediterranea]|uniref:ATP-binding protein n=1 Tax=Martelella mediterranea TaxID=293089 RepID=UPI001E4434F2|nr:ATP-binding protein [Martelella mediterranea]MCD1636948.1 response regulator [Martelella mediterranea]